MSLWLNWKERLTSNQKVAGSSPAKDFKKYLTYIMKKLRGGNIVGSIIGGVIKFIIYFVLTICVLMFMIVSIAIIAIAVGGYIMLQKLLELINIVTGGLTVAINPIFSGITKGFGIISDLPKMFTDIFKGKKYKPKSSSTSKGFAIPKIPTKPEEIIYAALGIPPQQESNINDEEEEDEEEYCSAN